MKLFRQIKKLTLVVILGFSSLGAAEVKSSVDAILSLGEQMSNVRKMLETYALIATEVSYKSPSERLKVSMSEYESLIADMEKNFKDKEIQESVTKSHEGWKPVKAALLTALENNDAKRLEQEGLFIHANIRTVIKELGNMKKFLLTKEKIKNSELLDASIEISASARRLSAHYMMKMWDINDPTIEEHWNEGIQIYTDSIKTLKASSFYKDEAFKKLLDASEKQLSYFSTLWMFSDKFVPVIVQERADSAYNDANDMSRIILQEISK